MSASVGDVTTALRRLAAACGEAVLPGATEEEVAALARRVPGVPPDFLALLRDQDGFEANGLRVFGAVPRTLSGGVVLPALDEMDRDLEGVDDHLVLAQGSSALWAVHRPSGAFHELDVVPAQVLAGYPDLPSLLLAAVAAQS